MRKRTILIAILLTAAISTSTVWGKDIVQNAPSLKGSQKAYIRADGLACYFCAYGLERFFRRSGSVASYDMKMKEGVVEIIFIKGKPLLTIDELHQIVYDAGYTPRETTYELVGRLEKSGGKYLFHPDDTGQSFPVTSILALPADPETLIGKTMAIKTKAKEGPEGSMLLEPLSFAENN